jgi:hypothetical protein
MPKRAQGVCLAGVVSVAFLWAIAGSTTAAVAGPFAGPNGKLATVKNTVGEDTYLGTVTPGGIFDPIYREWDYGLAGSEFSFSPDGSRIALNVGWRPSQLAIARVSGGRLKYVDTHRLQAYDPFWAGNGRIVFTGQTLKGHRTGTYSIRPDGRGLRKLFAQVIFAASSDLDEFVGASSSAFSHFLDLRDRNGKRVAMLARNRKHFFVDPAISPDGRWIVYERYLDPPGKWEQAGDRLGDIYIVRRDGTHRRRLTNQTRDMLPTFSPDGRWVAFTRFDRKGYFSNIAALRLDRPGRVLRITHTRETIYQELSWGRRR